MELTLLDDLPKWRATLMPAFGAAAPAPAGRAAGRYGASIDAMTVTLSDRFP